MSTWTRDPEELWNAGSTELGQALIAAVERGDFQIVPDSRGTTDDHPTYKPQILIQTEDGDLYRGTQGDNRYNFTAGPDEFDVEVSSFEHLIVRPGGEGRDDLQEELERRQNTLARMKREMGEDPEGAFGGRGNNIII